MAPQLLTSVLPLVKSLSECASYDLTVAPYYSQLQELPERVLQAASSPVALKQVYQTTNPLVFAFAFSLFLGPIFLIVSEVNKNYSQVDRVWSILPTVYISHYTLWAHLNGLPTQRLDHALAVGCIWTARLTFNYWRRGGYNIGSEDYRWEILRKNMNPALFFAFNVTFISTIQSVLLFVVTTPLYVLLLVSRVDPEMSTLDHTVLRGMVGLIALCLIADGQQQKYQNAKAKYRKDGVVQKPYTREELERGFIVRGLWAWSRHPNFAAEQAIWVSLYAWTCFKTGELYNWTAVGALSYLALFQGSTWFTELLSSQKYPEYKEYQKRVGMFLPWITTAIHGPVAETDPALQGPSTIDRPKARK